jgi:hypothetical protein
MTLEEARLRAERYRSAIRYAFLLDGKLYLLLARYGADLYLTHILREDGSPETLLIGSVNCLCLMTPTELQDQGATLLYGEPSSPSRPSVPTEKGISP